MQRVTVGRSSTADGKARNRVLAGQQVGAAESQVTPEFMVGVGSVGGVGRLEMYQGLCSAEGRWQSQKRIRGKAAVMNRVLEYMLFLAAHTRRGIGGKFRYSTL